MPRSDIDYDRLTADQTRTIVRLLNAITDKTNEALLVEIDMLGGPRIPANSISKRKTFPPGFNAHLKLLVDGLSPRNRAFIAENVSSQSEDALDAEYGEIGTRLAYTLDLWLNYADLNATKFAGECANTDAAQNGRYIIFRSPDGERLQSSRMNIFWSKGSKMLLPAFVTRRQHNGNPRLTRGVACMLGETVYTIGRLKRENAIRFSRLKLVRRGPNTDLYGVRLGTSGSTERPYAHLVYAYQIKRSRGSDLHDLLKVDRLTDPFLDAQIENMDQIRRLITSDGLVENGLQTNPLEI